MRFIYFYSIGIDVLPASMSNVPQVVTEARRGCWIAWNWSYRWLLTIMWVLEFNPSLPEEKLVLSTSEPPPQSQVSSLDTFHSSNVAQMSLLTRCSG